MVRKAFLLGGEAFLLDPKDLVPTAERLARHCA